MEASKSPFPYPLQLGALEAFCHPHPRHLFARPAYYEGQALASNGYMGLRVNRGLWLEEDFESPPEGFLTRFLGKPWPDLKEWPASDFRALAEVRGMLFKHGPRALWVRNVPSHSPVVRIGPGFLARLNHLQLVSRLPNCEVIVPATAEHPLVFRFSGGVGMMVADPRLKEASFSIFQTQRCPIDGGTVPRNTGPLVLKKPDPYWKSFEKTD